MEAPAIRLFFAVWPDQAARRRLESLALDVAAARGGRATRPDNLHVTLAFLGELPAARRDLAVEAATRVAFSAFDVRVDRLELRARQAMAWATESTPTPALGDLAGHLRAMLSARGFEFEHRRFTAHVTLARDIACHSEVREIEPVTFAVREFTLVRSEPGPGGSRYRIEQRFAGAQAPTPS